MNYLLLFTAFFLYGCWHSSDVASPKIVTTPPPGTGMVAAANPHATEAGLKILRAGGTAVDAAIAVQATLGLVEPQSSGIGGGAFMVVYDPKSAKVWAYDGREEAPSGATVDMFVDPSTGMQRNYFQRAGSGQSTGTPGAIAMLHKAHQDYGNLDWGCLFNSTIALAEKGFRVSPRMTAIITRMAPFILKNDKETREYFFTKDGAPIPEGFLRDNHPYANTLRAMANNPRALLEGVIAKDIIAKVQSEPFPGTLTLADMAKYEPRKEEALCTMYRAHAICGALPPSSGGIAVQSILGILENFDMEATKNTTEGWHLFAEASFLAYADRDEYVADPTFEYVPTHEMLNEEYLEDRAALINTDSVMKNVKAGDPVGFSRGQDATPDNPGTSHFTIVDKDGLTVSMTTSIEGPFGSHRMVRGFLLNNQLTDFSSYEKDKDGMLIANRVEPRKRPRSSMSPHIVFGPDGKLLFTTGSPGGSSIIAYTAKSIVGIIDWGMSPQEAIELPNVIARNGSIKLEAQNLRKEDSDELDRGAGAKEFGMEERFVSGLERLGHTVRRSGGEISGLHIIYRQKDGSLIGGADPRREGTVGSQ